MVVGDHRHETLGTRTLWEGLSVLDLDLLVDQRQLFVSADQLLAEDVTLRGHSLAVQTIGGFQEFLGCC